MGTEIYNNVMELWKKYDGFEFNRNTFLEIF